MLGVASRCGGAWSRVGKNACTSQTSGFRSNVRSVSRTPQLFPQAKPLGLGSFSGALRPAGRGGRIDAFPFDLAWAPSVDAESIAPQLFAFSIVPYSGFLYYLTKSKSAPPVALFGFYFLLVFVAVSIPAGIYAKVHYGQSLANVDWLHGGAEAFLTITNLLIVIGMRQGIRQAENEKAELKVVSAEEAKEAAAVEE
ncbi:hypothetical protein BSKO_12871 [Bryopsis sp. KO-2023]|nr:hypothetical protein BSKO_12871 [Bryopsis sp. KO-2023]